MKKFLFVILCVEFLPLFSHIYAQKPHYYYFDKVIELTENPIIRYIDLVDEVSKEQEASLRGKLREFATEAQYGTNKYIYTIANPMLIDSVLKITEEFQNIISLNSVQYKLDSLTILVPQRMIFLKLKKDSLSLEDILRTQNIKYSSIEKDKYSTNCYTVLLDYDDALSVSSLLYNTGLFEYAEPDFYSSMQLLGYEDNPLYSQQWSVHNDSLNIGLLSAWNKTTGHRNIKIALLDVGVAYDHSDLAPNMLPGYSATMDCYGYDCGGYDNFMESHGTLCAGIMIAANNNEGIVGVSHSSKLMSVKCSEIRPTGTKDHYPTGCDHIYAHHLMKALNAACYTLKADIITIALTDRHPSSAITDKITEVCQNGRDGKGLVFVASSGNNEYYMSSDTSMSCFAIHPDVISVGSIAPTGLRSDNATNTGWFSFSSCYGEDLDLVASGELIPTTDICSAYSTFAGTSAASSHVAGVAALILSVNPCLTGEEVKHIIESTCTKIRQDVYTYDNNPNHPNGTWNIEVGHGLVNAGAAVAMAQQMHEYTVINDSLISSNNTWTGNKQIISDLIIDSLATLTITDTLFVANSARIVVRPGGKLVLDGGTLTSACGDVMWQGIEVVGDRTKRQLAIYQGKVELRNGATIENAHCGIRTGLGNDNWHTTGGIIVADSAFFINNRRAVAFMSYTNHSLTGVITDNVSHFTNCEFIVDNNNLFAQNNCGFIDHVTMWQVRGVKFKGCRFSNTTTANAIGDRRHAIYTEDAGFEVTTYCRDQYYSGCECPENKSVYCEFSGFTTAIEANTTGDQHVVWVNRANFRDNETGIKINGNHFATVIRNDFDLQASSTNMYNAGLCLNNCSGYQVEGNRFHRASGHYNYSSMGIGVQNSGVTDNSIYRNVFDNLSYGIYVTGTNGNATGGLQMLCGDFSGNGTDIYLATSHTMVSSLQGSLQLSAGNTFSKAKNYNIQNMSDQSLVYFYTGTPSSSNPYYPSLRTSNVLPYLSNTANPCASMLCDGGGTPRSLVEFQSDADADTYYAAVRSLMSDTVLDLNELEQWHTAAQSANLANYANIGDPYSLAETRFMEGNVETFAGDAEDAEMANYAEFHALKLLLRGDNNDNSDNQDNIGNDNSPNSLNSPTINWYSLTESQIAQLQTIAERNTGRASVMAKGVLCFFHGICYEDEWDDAGAHAGTPQQGDDTTGTRAKRTAMDTDNDAILSVYPNPTDDILFIELSGGAGIANMALYDLQGRVVGTRFIASATGASATVNMRNIPAGVYVLRVTDADGKEYHRKIVRK